MRRYYGGFQYSKKAKYMMGHDRRVKAAAKRALEQRQLRVDTAAFSDTGWYDPRTPEQAECERLDAEYRMRTQE